MRQMTLAEWESLSPQHEAFYLAYDLHLMSELMQLDEEFRSAKAHDAGTQLRIRLAKLGML